MVIEVERGSAPEGMTCPDHDLENRQKKIERFYKLQDRIQTALIVSCQLTDINRNFMCIEECLPIIYCVRHLYFSKVLFQLFQKAERQERRWCIFSCGTQNERSFS